MLRRKTIGLADLERCYPLDECVGFIPTHEVELDGAQHFVAIDQSQDGVCFGYIPGVEEPAFAVLPSGLWQCLFRHGRVKAREVKYKEGYKPPGATEGAVYFMQAGVGGAVKVGWSRDVLRRQKEGQVFQDKELRVLGAIPGPFSLEKEVHALLAKSHKRGEWFFPTAEVLDMAAKGTIM